MVLIGDACAIQRVSVQRVLINSPYSKRGTDFLSKVLGLTGDRIQSSGERGERKIKRALEMDMECEGSGGQVWSLWCVLVAVST